MTNEETKLAKELRELIRRVMMIENKINAIYECSAANRDLVEAFTMIEHEFSKAPEFPDEHTRKAGG